MNERIQILAGEAEDYADSIVDQGGEFHQAYTQKLAELIVQECANVGERYANGNYEVYNQILARFGMEEDEE
jgi:hypothetical protein